MKIKFSLSPIIIIFLMITILGCKEEPPKVIPPTPTATIPTLTTTTISGITSVSAVTGGSITSDGGAAVTARGVCWGINQSPTTSDNKTSDGSGVGNYTSAISGLSSGGTYYVRAYATNSVGTAYGNQISFNIAASLPTISTTSVTEITATTATSGGNISLDGGSAVSARGVCWSTSQIPTISNSKTTNGTGKDTFTSNITGLTGNTTYYIRAYATNSVGIAYGEQLSFTTYKDYVEIGGLKWAIQDVSRYREFENENKISYMYSWNLCDEDLFDGGVYDQNAENSVNWEDSHNPCPTGWRLPTSNEFTTLLNNIKRIIINEYIDGNKFKGTGAFSFQSGETLTLSMIPSTEYHTEYDQYYRPYYVNDKRVFQYWTKNSESQHYAYALNTSVGKETLAVRRLLKRNHCFIRCIKE